jgi:hypothetical protein
MPTGTSPFDLLFARAGPAHSARATHAARNAEVNDSMRNVQNFNE